jgi:hypothetical protein
MSINKLIKDPLVHFLLIGGIVFLIYSQRGGDVEEVADNSIIEISDKNVQDIRDVLEKQLRRIPTEDEVAAGIELLIKQEVLYREGMAIGLDKDDAQVRLRVAEKMLFLTRDLAEPIPPTEEELQAFLEAGHFRIQATIDFEQLYFSPSRERNRAQLSLEAATTLQELLNGSDPDSYKTISYIALNKYVMATESQVINAFGAGRFSDEVFNLPTDNSWQGPFESIYGVHLARVSKIVAAVENPSLDQVRDEVTRVLMEKRRIDANEAEYNKLKDRYEVDVSFPAALIHAEP